jgi:hypothetical protein
VFAAVVWGEFGAAAVGRVATVVFAIGCAALGYALAARFRINLIRLSRLEPPRRS